MVNSDDFSKRLQKVMEYYDISAAAFADAIDVGRSSISHIISGRNKPSLDFVLKIVQTYPEVELYWLLNGKGNFPADSVKEKPRVASSSASSQPGTSHPGRFAPTNKPEASPSPEIARAEKEIKKIVIFYNDGTFEAFEN